MIKVMYAPLIVRWFVEVMHAPSVSAAAPHCPFDRAALTDGGSSSGLTEQVGEAEARAFLEAAEAVAPPPAPAPVAAPLEDEDELEID